MDSFFRQQQRMGILGQDRFAFRHARRLTFAPREKTQKQIFGQHLRDDGYTLNIEGKAIQVGRIGSMSSQMNHEDAFYAFQGLTVSLAVAIYRVCVHGSFGACTCNWDCRNMAPSQNAEVMPCFDCSCTQPEITNSLKELFQVFKVLGYDDQASKLLAAYDYYFGLNSEVWI